MTMHPAVSSAVKQTQESVVVSAWPLIDLAYVSVN